MNDEHVRFSNLTDVESSNVSRRFTDERKVRLSDTWTDGALRLDALARYLQDVAADDMADAGLGSTVWVVRSVHLRLEGRPALHDRVEITTFCSGLGSRWAERRTSVTGPSSRIEARAVWVHIDPDTGMPARYPPRVVEICGPAVAGRKVSARLTLPNPPVDAPSQPWPVRSTDFDVLGHVNNAVYWFGVDDAERRTDDVLLEYRTPIGPDLEVELVTSNDRSSRWLVSPAGVHAAARLAMSDDR